MFIGKNILLLFAGVLAGTLLLMLAYLLPVNTENRDASYELIETEGWYPRASVTALALDGYFHSFLPDVLDDSTDRIMLYTAMDTQTDRGVLERAMASHSEYMGDYSYYWHGYVSILRPLMFLFDYSELRIFNGLCQLLLVVLLASVIGREKGLRYVLLLLTSYILLSSVAMPLSLQFSWVFYIAFSGTLCLLLKRDFWSAGARYVYFFLVLGMCTSYFDLLTYPLFTWGMPLVWLMIMDRTQKEPGRWVREAVRTGLGWIAGYAGMWVMKWAIAAPVLGRNVFEEAVNEVFFRAGVQAGAESALSARLNAIYVNWKHYEFKIYFLVLLVWLAWWFCRSVWGGWQRSAKRYAYFLVGTSGIVWYFVLANHTQGHHFFTYRIFGVSILAFLAILLESVPGGVSLRGLRAGRGFRGMLRMAGVWGAASLLALPMALGAREELLVMNGEAAFEQIRMEKSLEIGFTPTFQRIEDLGLGLECAGAEGEYRISLWEGEACRYQYTMDIAGWNEGNYHTLNETGWKLDKGKEYRLTVEAVGNTEPVYVWVTAAGEEPLSEYRNLRVDDAEQSGQILSGITYWCRPVSRLTLVFLELTWIGIWMAAIHVFCPQNGIRIKDRKLRIKRESVK